MVDVIGRAKVIVEGTVDTASIGRSGGKIGDVLKRGALVGGAALTTLAAVGVETYKAFETAEAQSRKLNKVLDNMGESKAGPAVEKLADDLMRLTGIDDEVIKGGQTILATFDAVSESAGEVGGTFDRATRAAVDMSSVFGSVESASRVLGKALSDPAKAAALLKRSNVILNDEQKKLIENFLKAGDAAGAQDVILDALEDRYKGTAEAAGTESQKIATSFGELKENVGQLVAEMVSSLSGEGKGKKKSLSGAIYEASDAVDAFSKSESWETLQTQISDSADDFSSLAGPMETVFGWVNKLTKRFPQLTDVMAYGLNPLSLFTDAWDELSGVLEDVNDWIKEVKGSFDELDVPWVDKGKKIDFGDSDILDQLTGKAAGGPVRGLTLVGENGPELAQFSGSGGYVYNNSQTREMLATASGASVTNNFILNGPNSLSEARRNADWETKYGTRFGAATSAGGL